MNPIESFLGVLLFVVVVPILAFGALLGLLALLGSGIGALAGLLSFIGLGMDGIWKAMIGDSKK